MSAAKVMMLLVAALWWSAATAQMPRTINYQGFLTSPSGTPINTAVAMTFRLYDAAGGGTLKWSEIQPSVPVNNGIFNAVLGAVTPINLPFDIPYFLTVTINADPEMSPRQALEAVPYALRALNLDAAASVPATQITGTISTTNLAATQLLPAVACAPNQIPKWSGSAWACAADAVGGSGTVTSVGAGTGLSGGPITASGSLSVATSYQLPQSCTNGQIASWNGAAWVCTSAGAANSFVQGGNAFGATAVLGAIDNRAVQIISNGTRVMSLQSIAGGSTNSTNTVNVLGGSPLNAISANVVGATIAGGGGTSAGTSNPNAVQGDFGTVAGGASNTAGGVYATVAGGGANVASGAGSTVAGGAADSATGSNATVGGGWINVASGDYAFVGGGDHNVAAGHDATVSGGANNTTDPAADHATVGGGFLNNVSGAFATVGGGTRNGASGVGATIAGGGTDGTNVSGNAAGGAASFIGGGYNNNAGGLTAAVVGGQSNYATEVEAIVGGGSYNTASGANSVVVGGAYNTASGIGAAVVGGGTLGGATVASNNATGNISFIGGGMNNLATGYGATVGGGGLPTATCTNLATSAANYSCGNQALGDHATVSGGSINQAFGASSTIAGGRSNVAVADYSTVGGGTGNSATQHSATIAGGYLNHAQAQYATVGGGYNNGSPGYSATVGGGYQNWAYGGTSTIGGGQANSTNQNAGYSTIGGGYNNTATASAYSATISGGYNNYVNGSYSTIAGGINNAANSNYSFVAGSGAGANEYGMFVWADAQPHNFYPTCCRAPGLSANTFNVRATGGVWFLTGIDAFGNPTWGCYLSNGNNWACSSDRNVKRNLIPVDGQEVLTKVAAMPVYRWQPKDGPNREINHVGPMAQDFYSTFGLGDSDKAIGMQDAEGIALAAIQGLNAKLEARDTQHDEREATLQREIQDKDAKIEAQAGRIAALELQASELNLLKQQLVDLQSAVLAMAAHASQKLAAAK